MLCYLLDEHFSPKVADRISAARSDITIHSVIRWRSGTLLKAKDEALLFAALSEQLTLVTYDQKTNLSLLGEWGEVQRPRGRGLHR